MTPRRRRTWRIGLAILAAILLISLTLNALF